MSTATPEQVKAYNELQLMNARKHGASPRLYFPPQDESCRVLRTATDCLDTLAVRAKHLAPTTDHYRVVLDAMRTLANLIDQLIPPRGVGKG